METLRGLKDKQPFFLGVDAFDPHEAWNVPTTFKLRFKDRDVVEPILPFKTPYSKVEDLEVTEDQVQQVRELYAAELTYIDSWIGRLLNLWTILAWPRNRSSTTCQTTASCSESTAYGQGQNSMARKEIHSVPYISATQG